MNTNRRLRKGRDGQPVPQRQHERVHARILAELDVELVERLRDGPVAPRGLERPLRVVSIRLRVGKDGLLFALGLIPVVPSATRPFQSVLSKTRHAFADKSPGVSSKTSKTAA